VPTLNLTLSGNDSIKEICSKATDYSDLMLEVEASLKELADAFEDHYDDLVKFANQSIEDQDQQYWQQRVTDFIDYYVNKTLELADVYDELNATLHTLKIVWCSKSLEDAVVNANTTTQTGNATTQNVADLGNTTTQNLTDQGNSQNIANITFVNDTGAVNQNAGNATTTTTTTTTTTPQNIANINFVNDTSTASQNAGNATTTTTTTTTTKPSNIANINFVNDTAATNPGNQNNKVVVNLNTASNTTQSTSGAFNNITATTPKDNSSGGSSDVMSIFLQRLQQVASQNGLPGNYVQNKVDLFKKNKLRRRDRRLKRQTLLK